MKLNHRLVLAVTLLTVMPYLWLRMDQGWIAHDEGLLGQSAERVLQGELPHLDFDDPYTGGQAMLHAVAFKILGVQSLSLRYVLLAFSCLFAIAHYAVAARFAPAWLAGLLTWLAVAWTVPNYFASLPSWYNLFFALLGSWALIKYDETERRHWLALAGMLGGLSFLIKLSGLFYVAAGLLFLVYREQQHVVPESSEQRRRTTFSLFSAAALSLFVVLLVMTIRHRLTVMDTLMFVVPGAALSLFLVVNEWRDGGGSNLERFKRLLFPIVWFGLGVAVPITVFLIPYAVKGGLDDFILGVFVLPQKRMKWAGYPLPTPASLLAALPLVFLLLPRLTTRSIDSVWIKLVGGIASFIGILYGANEAIYHAVWNSTRPLFPIVVVAGCLMLRSVAARRLSSQQRCLLFLLLAMSAMISLVQFPYSFGIYFCYAAPFGFLALAALIFSQENAPRCLFVCVLCFYFGFALVWLNYGRVQRIGIQFSLAKNDTPMSLGRSGLRISAGDAKLYEQVIEEIASHSKPGDYIYAAVDCPEIYFLAGRKNPTRTFYDFFEPDFEAESAKRVSKLQPLLDKFDVNVVVLHWQGEFSGALSYDFAGSLAQHYPNVKHFVRDSVSTSTPAPIFSVAWRK